MPAAGGASSGRQAGDLRAGGAYYEFNSQDNLSKTIDQLEAKTKAFSKTMKSLGGSAFAGGLVGGLVGGGFAEMAMKAGGAMADWLKGTKALNQALQDMQIRLDSIAEKQKTNLAASAGWRETMIDTGDQVASIDSDIAGLSDQWNKLEEVVKASMALMARANAGPFGGLGFSAAESDKRAGIINANVAKQNEIFEQIAKLRGDKAVLLDPEKNKAFVQSITNATKALRDQLTTWGLVGTAAERALFKAGGASDKMLSLFDAHATELARLTRLGASPPPWLSMALGAAGQAANAAAPQGLPPWLGAALSFAGGASEAASKLQRAAASVTGTFSGSASRQQFAYGDSLQEKIADGISKVASNTDPAKVAAAIVAAITLR